VAYYSASPKEGGGFDYTSPRQKKSPKPKQPNWVMRTVTDITGRPEGMAPESIDTQRKLDIHNQVRGMFGLAPDYESPYDTGLEPYSVCLLYTSDAADDLLCVDLGAVRCSPIIVCSLFFEPMSIIPINSCNGLERRGGLMPRSD